MYHDFHSSLGEGAGEFGSRANTEMFTIFVPPLLPWSGCGRIRLSGQYSSTAHYELIGTHRPSIKASEPCIAYDTLVRLHPVRNKGCS